MNQVCVLLLPVWQTLMEFPGSAWLNHMLQTYGGVNQQTKSLSLSLHLLLPVSHHLSPFQVNKSIFKSSEQYLLIGKVNILNVKWNVSEAWTIYKIQKEERGTHLSSHGYIFPSWAPFSFFSTVPPDYRNQAE